MLLSGFERLTNLLPKNLRLSRFLRGQGPEAGPITLDRKRIFILPTRYGIVYALILFAMLIGSINYANNMGFLLTFLLVGVGLVAILHTYLNMVKLRFRCGTTQAVFAGHPINFEVIIENDNPTPRLAIALHFPHQTPHRVNVSTGFNKILLPAIATRRGFQKMERFIVYSNFPMGLFHAWAHLDFHASALVYPHPATKKSYTSAAYANAGTQQGQSKGLDDFSGFKNYTASDSFRHIYWKGVARGQKMMTKQFSKNISHEIIFDWHELLAYDTEERLSILCRFILDAENHDIAYGLIMPQKKLSPDRGPEHRHRCLKLLALY